MTNRNMNALYDQFAYRKEKEDLELEMSELKQKLNLKNTEFINLQQEFQENAALLSLNELRLQQVILIELLKITILSYVTNTNNLVTVN